MRMTILKEDLATRQSKALIRTFPSNEDRCPTKSVISIRIDNSTLKRLKSIGTKRFNYFTVCNLVISPLMMSGSVKREIPKHFFPASFRDAPI